MTLDSAVDTPPTQTLAQTQYLLRCEQSQARLETWGNLALVAATRNSLAEEINAISSAAAIWDSSPIATVRVQGPDSISFLQGMVSNDLKKISSTHLQPHLISTNKGKIIFQLYVFKISEEELVIICEPGEAEQISACLEHYHIREDIEQTMAADVYLRLDLFGPKIPTILQNLGCDSTNFTWHNTTVRIAQNPIEGVQHWIALISPSVYHDLWQELSRQAMAVGFEALEQVRIHQGVPKLGKDFTRENFPQEAQLMTHISYTKGCYVGQEPHARMFHRGHPNWQVVAIRVPEQDQLQVGQELFFADEAVGVITGLSGITQAGNVHGLAWVKQIIAKNWQTLSLAKSSPAQVILRQVATALVTDTASFPTKTITATKTVSQDPQ